MKYAYRIMKYEYFVDMVERKELHLVHPSGWWGQKDRQTPRDDRQELLGFCELIRKVESAEQKTLLYAAYSHHYAQSWSMKLDLNLWERLKFATQYVAISVEYKKLSTINDTLLRKITYVNDVVSYISELGISNEDVINSLCVKRKEYESDKELRLIYQEKKTPHELALESFNIILTHEIKNGKKVKLPAVKAENAYLHRCYDIAECIQKRNNISIYKRIPYKDINDFISCVYYHPEINNVKLHEVEAFCNKNNLMLKKLGS